MVHPRRNQAPGCCERSRRRRVNLIVSANIAARESANNQDGSVTQERRSVVIAGVSQAAGDCESSGRRVVEFCAVEGATVKAAYDQDHSVLKERFRVSGAHRVRPPVNVKVCPRDGEGLHNMKQIRQMGASIRKPERVMKGLLWRLVFAE